MNFKKYNDIENSFNREFMERVMFELADQGKQDVKFVVQEKVHGSNSSFLCSGDAETIEFGKRTAKVGQGENFFDHPELVNRYRERVVKVFDLLKSRYPDLTQIQVYGEFFGGIYPHPEVQKVKDVKIIQKGVFYSPIHEFYGFDIRIYQGEEDETGKLLTVPEVNEIFESTGIFYAKTLMEGTLKECLEYPNLFNSKIPEWLGLPLIDDNTCEGVVIRPVEPLYMKNGSRIIIKNKNEKFSEKKSKKKNPNSQPAPEYSPELQALISEAERYVNTARMDNVVSKMGEIDSWTKSFGIILGNFTKDALEDFMKEHGKEYDSLEKSEQKILNKKVNQLCANCIKGRIYGTD